MIPVDRHDHDGAALVQYGDKEGAIGYLVGQENQGLNIMFEMMNHARFAVGLQGLAIAERSYQQAKQYSFERVQGVPLGGKQGDAIIHHPDVLRLNALMKSEIEAMRALAIYGAYSMDMIKSNESDYWINKTSLLIPIIKG